MAAMLAWEMAATERIARSNRSRKAGEPASAGSTILSVTGRPDVVSSASKMTVLAPDDAIRIRRYRSAKREPTSNSGPPVSASGSIFSTI
jgi:hypothetical protein